MGMGSVEARSSGAWLGAWELGLADTAAATGCRSWLEVKERWPAIAATITRLDDALSHQTGKPAQHHRWTQRAVRSAAKQQKELLAPAQERTKAALLNRLDVGARNRLLGGATKEARCWLRPPVDEDPLPDPHFLVAARMRYGAADPVPRGSATCQNSAQRTGRVCGAGCGGDGGQHSLVCKIGGGVQQRHDNVRDAILDWMKEFGLQPQAEQNVPEWGTPRERAVLDIAYTDSRGGRRYVDVAVVAGDTHCTLAPSVRTERHERKKHRRYPGPALVPFVLDVRGAWGKEALAWVRNLQPQIRADDRRAATDKLKWQVAAALQSAVADAATRSGAANKRHRHEAPGAPAPAPAPVGAPQQSYL